LKKTREASAVFLKLFAVSGATAAAVAAAELLQLQKKSLQSTKSG